MISAPWEDDEEIFGIGPTEEDVAEDLGYYDPREKMFGNYREPLEKWSEDEEDW